MGSGGCDFHQDVRSDCVHCLGWELALAKAEIARLHDWIKHLVEGDTADLIVVLEMADLWLGEHGGTATDADEAAWRRLKEAVGLAEVEQAASDLHGDQDAP